MALNWDLIVKRLSTCGPDGKLLSAITGDETEGELRALVVRLAQSCPICQEHFGCPFRSLHHLYHATLQAWLNGMSRPALVGLFELECEARNRTLTPKGYP